MKKDELNNYPEGFLQEFREPVTFKLLGLDGDDASPVKGKRSMPAVKKINAFSVVNFKNGNGDTIPVPIGYVKSTKPNGDVIFGDGLSFGFFNDGQIQLNPNIPSHRDLFNYLNHCEFNYDSPYTFPSAKKIFYRFSLERIAKENTGKRKGAITALKLIEAASEETINSVYLILGKSRVNSLVEKIDKLEEEAFINSDKVINAFEKLRSSGTRSDASTPPNNPVDDAESPKLVNSEVLVNKALEKGALRKAMGQLKFRNSEGGDIFSFKKVSEGLGTAEEQLARAMDSDKELYVLIKTLTEL